MNNEFKPGDRVRVIVDRKTCYGTVHAVQRGTPDLLLVKLDRATHKPLVFMASRVELYCRYNVAAAMQTNYPPQHR
jgi:hypothetical protein